MASALSNLCFTQDSFTVLDHGPIASEWASGGVAARSTERTDHVNAAAGGIARLRALPVRDVGTERPSIECVTELPQTEWLSEWKAVATPLLPCHYSDSSWVSG